MKLSPQQQAVVNWVSNDKGSLELVARAGCGKTSTLMEVIKTIAASKLGDVAVMAYNKAIANELKAKLDKLGIDWKVAQAGTVHSFGFGAWRKVAPNVQIDDKKVQNLVASLVDTYSNHDVYRDCGSTVSKLVSLAKQRALGHLVPIENTAEWMDIWDHFGLENDVTEDYRDVEVIAAAQKVYRLSLDRCREVIDFDDMILAPLYHKARFWPKDWILVDESQDTNPARRALALAMLKPRTGRMIFVGDDRQAIYGFTGADSNSMAQLKQATNAKTLPLTVTYRCPKAVVKEAQRLVADITAHPSAPEGKVSSIPYADLEKQNLCKDDVILCRNTAPLVSSAYTLLSKGIACRVEGREIGQGLIKLARRWKIKMLDKLLEKLEDYQARQTAKFMSQGKEEKIDSLVDQLDCLRVVISRCQLLKKHTVDELVSEIESMFGNTKEGEQPAVLTLSTGHKSKGREFDRVFLLDMAKYCPSPYAKKEWQRLQEANLEYVMITRSKRELIYVNSES